MVTISWRKATLILDGTGLLICRSPHSAHVLIWISTLGAVYIPETFRSGSDLQTRSASPELSRVKVSTVTKTYSKQYFLNNADKDRPDLELKDMLRERTDSAVPLKISGAMGRQLE